MGQRERLIEKVGGGGVEGCSSNRDIPSLYLKTPHLMDYLLSYRHWVLVRLTEREVVGGWGMGERERLIEKR